MPKNTPRLTTAKLRELLSYSPENGEFRWKISPSRKVKAGDLAGYKDGHGYIRIRIGKQGYRAHRLAWFYVNLRWPTDQLDHINRVRSDNRIANLRQASASENQQNRAANKNNKSGHIGVSWFARDALWQASIQTKGKTTHLGFFKSIEDAIEARKKGKAEQHIFQPTDKALCT